VQNIAINSNSKAPDRIRDAKRKEQLAPKQRAVQKTMRGRFHGGAGGDCLGILDRISSICDPDPRTDLRKVTGVRPGRSIFPHATNHQSFQAYGHTQWFECENSRMKFYVQSQPLHGWLAPASVTLIADDRTGLLPEEVLPILDAIRKPKLTMVEFAIDFSPLTGVNRSFVRKHGVFGKLHRDLDTTNTFGDWWGARRGAKRTKSYFKDEVGGHRVEIEMRSRFLNHYGIRSVFDFDRFVDLLPRHHIWFARLDEGRLITRLQANRVSASETIRVVRRVRELANDLSDVLDYLRGSMGMKNTRRLLVPLRQNQLVREALREWGTQWRMR
jgi:hypothetical protein